MEHLISVICDVLGAKKEVAEKLAKRLMEIVADATDEEIIAAGAEVGIDISVEDAAVISIALIAA